MSFLTPLGFLGLLALLILLLIYIIKPSYQNKMLPSTYIWKQSLKFKKMDRPLSKLKNILIIICQILIIVLSSTILATPFINTKSDLVKQNILIIDGSANMMAEENGVSRFNRAKSMALEFSKDSIKSQKQVTIIIAGTKASYIVKNEIQADVIEQQLKKAQCSFTAGDLKGSINLVNEQIELNALSNVYYYTATKYNDLGDIEIIDVSGNNDWNVAILDTKAELVDNLYEFSVDVACYGKDGYVNVFINVNNVNNSKRDVRADLRINCTEEKISTAVFKDLEIYAYETVDINIKMDDESKDGFIYDDSFIIYGGKKETLTIQYYSSKPNNFFNSSLMVLKNKYSDKWDIKVTNPTKSKDVKSVGCDLYIYEHIMPSEVPTDGVVFLVNPDVPPSNTDFKLGQNVDGEFTMRSDVAHPIMNYIEADKITATRYKKVSGEGFEPLMYCGDDCVFAVKDTVDKKLAVLTLDLNRSNFAILLDFPVMINNMFNYFIPSTIEKNSFEVGEEINVNARGKDVTLFDGPDRISISAPTKIVIERPGKYQIRQTLLNNKKSIAYFYVKVPKNESNILQSVNNINNTFELVEPENIMKDTLIYLAGALLFVIAVERFLHSLENV